MGTLSCSQISEHYAGFDETNLSKSKAIPSHISLAEYSQMGHYQTPCEKRTNAQYENSFS